MYGIPSKHFVSGDNEWTRPSNLNNTLWPSLAISNVASFVVAPEHCVSDACLEHDAPTRQEGQARSSRDL